MKVKYSYLQDQFSDYEPILRMISQVVESGDYTLGDALRAFEERFAKVIGSKYAVGVNSGTDALFLSLKVADVKPGDEVISAPNTFIATVGAIIAAGAKPVFVDICDDYTIDVKLLEAAITPRTRAIIPVHYAGHPADMAAIMAIAKKHNLVVVEDACQAISAAIGGKCVGSFGLTGAFSLHPLKNLNVWGDGGAIVTDDSQSYQKLLLLRNHGLKNRDEVEIFGYNSRLDSIQACVGNFLINQLENITETRIKWAQKLDIGLSDLNPSVFIPNRLPDRKYVYHLYMLQVDRRDELLSFLLANDIEAKVHYPIPLHLQRAFEVFGHKKGDFPVTERLCEKIITLPVHQHLEEPHIDYMIAKIREFYA